jgi:hypothetical protein
VRALFDLHGALRDIHTLTEAQAAPIANFEVLMKNAAGWNGAIDRVIKVRLWDKMKAPRVGRKDPASAGRPGRAYGAERRADDGRSSVADVRWGNLRSDYWPTRRKC